MSLKFPVSLVGKRGGGGVTLPTHWFDLDDNGTWSDDGTKTSISLLEQPAGGVSVTNLQIGNGPVRTVASCPNANNQLYAANQIWDGDQDNLSFSAWVRPLIIDTYGCGVVAWLSNTDGSRIGGLRIINSTPDIAQGFVWDGDNPDDLVNANQSTTTVTIGAVWVHLAMTWDGTTLRVYQNAVEVDSQTNAAVGAFTANGCRFTIFKENEDNTRGTIGQMSSVGVWDVALSPDEISQLYNGGDGAQYADINWAT